MIDISFIDISINDYNSTSTSLQPHIARGNLHRLENGPSHPSSQARVPPFMTGRVANTSKSSIPIGCPIHGAGCPIFDAEGG